MGVVINYRHVIRPKRRFGVIIYGYYGIIVIIIVIIIEFNILYN